MKKLLPLLIISFLAWLPTTDAQLTISGADVVVCDNGTVSINVSVSNFIDITSAQFAATWDPDVVQFTSVTNNMPPSALYNTVNAPTGELRFSWFDANPPPGYTPPGPPVGSQIIFTINFSIVGDYTTDNFTVINFGSVPGFTMEIASTSGIVPNGSVVIDPGSVTLNDIVPPTITCPANVTVTAGIGQPSAVVTFPAPIVTDNCDVPANPAVSVPASGSMFPIGTTTVNATATDDNGNSANCSFSVTVNPAPANPNALFIEADDFAIECNDSIVNIPIRVRNFDLMTSAQFAVVWDELVLDYIGFTDSINATGHPTALYNFANTSTGQFRFSWFDADGVPGEDLPDSTVIFTLRFKLLDENELPDTVVITGVPGFNVEFSNTSGILGPADYAFNSAIVTSQPDIIPPVITCPGNQTLNANANCEATLLNYTALATATDNCTVAPNFTITQMPVAGTVITATTQVMLIATDEAGLKDTCSFAVTLVDNTNPVVVCPANVSVGTDLGECSAVVALVATATDNCGILSITDNGPAGDEFPIGTTTVTFTATDVNSNTATCQTTVTVADTENPTITCPANVSQGTSTGDCTAVATWAAPTAADNCPNITVTSTTVSGATFPVGDSTVVYTVEDQAGNTATCSFVVTVFDDEAPTITCPANQTLNANANCEATLLNYTGLATATDNCTVAPNFTITQMPAAGTVITATTQVMLIATDEAGLKDTCSFSVTLVDNTNPVVVCPANVSVGTDLGECSAVVALVATATDNCGILSITDNGPAGDEFPIGTTTVTFTATDVNSNTATCQTTVTVADTENPTITCPANVSQGTSTGDCTAVATWAAPTAADNCPNITVTSSTVSDATFPVGDSTVVYTVEDQAGNTATCSFVVTVLDDEEPVIDCPISQLVFVDTLCEATLPNYAAILTITDNCTTIPNFTITQMPAAGTLLITDTTQVMLIAEDEAGLLDTCIFDVILADTLLPIIVCPANDTMDVDSAACFATVVLSAASATDNCGIFSFTDDGPIGDEFPAGTTTVTYTATDVNGNIATCQTIVVVNDTIVPVITCPANILQTTDFGDCTTVVTWPMPTVVDNCPNVTITCTPPSGTIFPIGDSTVVCIVEDANGLRDTCEFVVTVFDGEAPSLQCPADITIVVSAGTMDTVINDIYLFFIGDNCSVDTSYYHFSGAIPNGGGAGSDASGTAFPVGTTTVTYFAEDVVGNVDSCSFNVTIVGDVMLTLTCPPNQTADNSVGNCGALVNGLMADVLPLGAAVDSFYQITGATIGNGVGFNANGAYNVGVSTVTFFAVSIGGDTISCSTTVTVNDVQVPVFTNCPVGPITLGNTTDECGLLFNGTIVPLAADNCPGVSITYNFPVGSLIPLGINTIAATATDGAGNQANCSFQLEVIDNQPPKFLNCQNGSTISRNNDAGQCGAVVSWSPVVTAQDNCALLALSETTPGNGGFFPVGNTTVTYTAVDDKGNVATCEIYISITDNQPPALSCPSNQPPVNTNLNLCSAEVNFPQPTATDNCTIVSFGPTTPAGPVFDEGVHTLIYEATDASGNTATCSFTVTVVDNQFPFIPNMPADLTVFTTAGDCGAVVNWASPSFPIDNCGIDAFGPTGGNSGDFFGVGVHSIKYVAVDINGNVTVETLVITVQDNLPPTINCPTSVSVTVDGSSIDDPSGILTGSQPIDCDNIQLDLAALTAADACGVFTFVQTAGLPSGSTFPIGATTMSYLATDNNGNTTACSFVINVLDFQIAPPTVSPGLVCEGGSVTFSAGTLPGATYTWTTGGNVVSTQPTFVLANAQLNQSGIYTLVVSTANCDIEFTTELNVSVVPVVTIDANDIFCSSNGLPLTLTGNNSSNANVTNWSWTFPNGSTPSGQTQVVQNPTAANSGTYCVTATTQFGCTATACEQIDVLTGPTTPVVTGTTANTCLGTQFTLFGQLYSGTNVTYTWSASPAVGSGLQSINNPIVSVQPTVAGTYTYSFFVTVDGCVSNVAEWVVNVEAAPTISLAVVGQTQCVDGNSDVTLVDNGSGATSWVWTAPFGTLPGNTSSVVLQNVTPSFSGVYTVTASSLLGCTSTATANLTFTSAPSPAAQLTASDATICEGSYVTLTGTPYNGVVNYIWIGNNVPPNSQSQSVIDVFPIGTGSFDYSFAAFVNGCYSDTVTVTVVVAPIPALDITVTGDLNCVAGNGSATLSTVVTGLTNIEWTDGNSNVLSNASPLVLNGLSAADSGPIFVTGTNQQGCIGYGSTILTITDGIAGLTATSNMVDCELGVLNLEASTIANASYTWFRPNNQIFATTQNATLNNATDGIYTVVVQAGGCKDTATVVVNLPNVLDANDKVVQCTVNVAQEFNILANDVYEPGQPFTITILQQGTHGTVTYVREDSIYRYNPQSGYWGSDFIIYEICYTDCPTLCSMAKVTFQIKPDPGECIVTTVISPNNDGYNDEFVVSCVDGGANPLNTLYIFNQWGDQVYEAAPYKNDWKGTHNGQELPDGTYFYIFKKDPDTPAQKGFVMIYR